MKIKIHEENMRWNTYKGYKIISKEPLGYGVYECELEKED